MAPGNRSLAFVVLGLLALSAVYLLGGLNWLLWDLRPGSPIGQSLGIGAALILLATLYYLPVRRSDSGRWSKPAAQTLHSLVGTLGATLAILHSQLALREWSTLVLLAIIGLLATGLYGRVIAPQRVGSAFGRSAIPYTTATQPNAASTSTSDLVDAKRRVLKSLNAEAREGEFVLRWHHWTHHPRIALRYHRLAIAERRTLARNPLSASAEISPLERLWRRLHLVLAALFIVGLLAHVLTTVFFAGYVADGREIYWWHLTQW